MYGVFIYDDIITNLKLSDLDVRLWLLLAKLSRKHGECFATARYLGEKLGVTRMTIFRSLKNLEKQGYLLRKRKSGKTSTYIVMSNERGQVMKKNANP